MEFLLFPQHFQCLALYLAWRWVKTTVCCLPPALRRECSVCFPPHSENRARQAEPGPHGNRTRAFTLRRRKEVPDCVEAPAMGHSCTHTHSHANQLTTWSCKKHNPRLKQIPPAPFASSSIELWTLELCWSKLQLNEISINKNKLKSLW